MSIKLSISCFFLFAIISMSFGINVRTTIFDVHHEGVIEQLGVLTLDIDSDAFANASQQSPVYIRFQTLHANGWAKTLVDQRSENYPAINLALRSGNSTRINPTTPPEAVQLARLIRGEKAGWIKVTNSSSSWLIRNGMVESPSRNAKVSLSLGIGGNQSAMVGSSTPSGGNENALDHSLADTRLWVDYSHTPFFGAGDLERLDFLALGSSTQGVEDQDFVTLGTQVGIGFSNDTDIARGASFIPCYEFHAMPNDFASFPMELAISRFQLTGTKEYQTDLPSLYFTNSSDFDWEQDSRLYIAAPGFNLTPLALDGSPIRGTTNIPDTHLVESELKLSFEGEAVWEITHHSQGEHFVGFEFHLKEGIFPIGASLKVEGLAAAIENGILEPHLDLQSYGLYKNRFVTSNELKVLGPIKRTVAVFELEEPKVPRQIIPYTGFDTNDWHYLTSISNPHNEPVSYTVIFYDRDNRILRVEGLKTLAAFASRSFSVQELYGNLAGRVLSGVEILSSRSLTVAGFFEDDDYEVLDVFPATQNLQSELYALHIPEKHSSGKQKRMLLPRAKAETQCF